MASFRPSYIKLYERGELQERVLALSDMMEECAICPRRCGVRRTEGGGGELGVCGVGSLPMVSSCQPHFGEEPPLVGSAGSGTIFMTRCNLKCVFCQNYDISHLGQGAYVSTDELARMMLGLQNQGCHNINFVTPTHQAAQIVASLPRAVEMGLDLPLVYNTGGYDSVETIKLLDGIFDIYMPDIKYGDDGPAGALSAAPDYVEVSRGAVSEMHRQVGELVIDERGIAERGLIIRHLVLPGGLAGTKEVMRFIAEELSTESYVNVMDQYRPCYKAAESVDYPDMGRAVTGAEFDEAVGMAKAEGLTRLAGVTV
ncbi:MAG: radical SAM protein [Thermodesulfobacteriota bacterium]